MLPALDLELEPGQVTALVGPSGAGKSTVAALLARMWDPQEGVVSIDGIDIRNLSSNELYAKVAILLQDVQLLRASVRDNIALSRPEATDEQVRAAAEAAQIHERIMQLPQGYDTVVDNTRLSGGERQRIGIARTLLADTPIVAPTGSSCCATVPSPNPAPIRNCSTGTEPTPSCGTPAPGMKGAGDAATPARHHGQT